MNILLLASQVSPYKGSEYAVGWNYIRYMSKEHNIYVLYWQDKEDVEKYIRSHPDDLELQKVKFRYVDKPDSLKDKFFLFLIRMRLPFSLFYVPVYHSWHVAAYKKALEILKNQHIDIIHYINTVGFKEPGLLWKINSVPYVWGPVSGVHIPNICLWKARGLDGTIDVLTRIVFHYGKMIFGRSVHKALKRADFVFSATLTTQREFKLWHNRETCYMPENGLSIDPPSMAKYYIKGETLRLIWVGRIDSGKALTILLNALELISKENWVLDVFGDGPLRKNMEKKTNRYGIKEKVRFHGNVSRDVSKTAMSKAHLHIISSTMEATTTVLFEAMENGVPTMTLDHCGMAGVVCDKCGIKISIHSYKQIVHDMASNIQDIIVNPNKINILFKGVLECAKKYTWKKRVEIFNQAYNKAKEHFQSKRKESL